MSQYFPDPYEHSAGNVKVELDPSNYATKANVKGAAGFDISTLASKTDLASLKTNVDDNEYFYSLRTRFHKVIYVPNIFMLTP